MKGHKSYHHGRKHRATGGVNEAAEDLGKKNQRYTYQSNVEDEAEERKRGGRAKKHAGKVHGDMAKHHAGRKPRKSGGSVESNPFSAARKGTPPKGRKLEMEFE
mgnify:CR=1 FL=1